MGDRGGIPNLSADKHFGSRCRRGFRCRTWICHAIAVDHDLVRRHMKKIEDTTLALVVWMICRAGRMVLAVEWTAPETRPSHLVQRKHDSCRVRDIVAEKSAAASRSIPVWFTHFRRAG